MTEATLNYMKEMMQSIGILVTTIQSIIMNYMMELQLVLQKLIVPYVIRTTVK